MKPIFLIPIIAGMVMMPSSRTLDAPKPLTPADLFTQSYVTQVRVPQNEPTAAEVRAAEYAARYTAYDQHHEAVQTWGHSGIVAPRHMM